MFKNVYTTKMSNGGKVLERRFHNINGKSSIRKRVSVIVLLCAVILLVALLVSLLSRTELARVYGMDYYAEFVKSNDFMPKIENLGKYESIDFRHYHHNMFIFESDAYILTVKYNAEEYEKEKKKAKSGYDTYARFVLDGFDFEAIDTGYYPKRMFFVGKSNSTCEITYVYFYDADLDRIDKSYAEFLIKDCGWEIEKDLTGEDFKEVYEEIEF